ncbi:RluA family pseudouridine synthase [Camelliibacillus cellulosilyticus]|uniref:Pseudouridine synthase n=1 Tax=Camelliibacillus cellulosilyticus TaxID=2174486 RepID=A0ABV9GG71_9BACL
MATTEIITQAEEAGERIDKFLHRYLESISRTRIQELIKKGEVFVNGKQTKANYKLEAGDRVTAHIFEPEPLDVKPEMIPLDIVYEDRDVIVVNKPRGVVVHPAPGHESGTLVNALLAHCRDLSGINGKLRPGIVHRIDKDTSGLLVCAKNDRAHQALADQLKEKTTHRVYQAIVHGVLEHAKGTIDAPIGRDEHDRKKMAVTRKHAKNAVTHFTVIERFASYTYVSCKLETGRTHQIRVHMAYIAHPVAGDPLYGPRKTLDINGQALHAAELGFIHPTSGAMMRFEAPLPDDMRHLLDELKRV